MDYTVFQDRRGRFMLSLPKRLGEALGLQGGDKVRWEVGPGRSLLLRPVKDGDGQRENVRGA